jgi:hypothetical protein
MVYSLEYTPRKLVATERTLDALYKAACNGLSGDNLAYAAGMTPSELRQLQQFDGAVDNVIGQAKAHMEMEMAGVVIQSAREGDAKAAMEILKHKHDWVAKQQVSVEIEQRISISDALRDANARVVDAGFEVLSSNPSVNSIPVRQTETIGSVSFGQSVRQIL